MAVEARNKIQYALGDVCLISNTLLFEENNLKKLAHGLVQVLPQDLFDIQESDLELLDTDALLALVEKRGAQ